MRLALFAFALLAPLAHAQNAPIAWAPEAGSFTLMIPEAGWAMEIAEADLDSVNVVNLPLVEDGVRYSVALVGARDTLRVAPEAAGVYRVHIVGLSREAAFDFSFWPPDEAHYSEAFRALHGGTSRFETPEAYEFVNVAFALTPSGRDTSNVLVWREGDYYDAVMAHFGALADHPFVAALEAVIQDDDFIPVRQSALGFRFSGDRFVADSVYVVVGRGQSRLASLRPLAEDFARASGFRAFYAASEPLYARQRQEMAALLPVQQMWDWLEAEFPERSQGYLTVFSPLTYGAHNAKEMRDGDYRESVIFIGPPAILDDAFGSVVGEGTPAWRQVEMSRMAFTEYDHTYVNPSMEPLAAEISAAMADLGAWKAYGGYDSPFETFAEYMTWAPFLLYVDAHYPADTAREAREGLVRFMEVNRGFVRFGAFADALSALYDARAEGETLHDLMPAIVRWTARQ
ncbi:DUF4932 domain-containing protein [Rubricoccus marinus]|uniref:DUF4932 domain-containing protein n=1 Tax=Rubricoccus marinus TaxID=716817 RepID=A0A259TUY5_9BACT|nr:DUF4932 domain-containing protein [Rubricoccus marinus]OZC01541.1 hypothetical protein BSZ36_00190 [Rubricoccus marinus]